MKQISQVIEDQILKIKNDPGTEFINIPRLKRPSDDQIREYYKQNENSFSLVDFAQWVVDNSLKR